MRLPDWKSWISALTSDIAAEARRELADAPDNPPVRFPDGVQAEVDRIAGEVPDRRLLIRQARLDDRPAMFLVSTAASGSGEDLPADFEIELQWRLDTTGWTVQQESSWPDFKDKRARTFEIQRDQKSGS